MKKLKEKNKTLTELVVTILLDLGVAPSWWGEITKTISCVLNKIPKTNNTTSPYEVLKNKTPDFFYLKTWVV